MIDFSIVIPVYQEAEIINRCIDTVRETAKEYSIEIIVVDGHPNGTTLAALEDNDVKTCLSRKGRAAQMNAGASMAAGEILVFLHADSRLPPEAFSQMEAISSDPSYVAGAFDLGVDSRHPFIRFLCYTSSLRARVSRIPYGDQGIFTTRIYFQSVGGFASIPIMEDVELMKRIKKYNHKIAIIPNKVVSSARRWEEEGILHAWLRNHWVRFRYFLGASPEKLARHYPDTRKPAGTCHD